MLKNRFVLQDGGGKLTHLHVGMGDSFGSADGIRLPPQFRVGFLEDFQRLIVVRLGLGDYLKHFNRLGQLRLFIPRHCRCHV